MASEAEQATATSPVCVWMFTVLQKVESRSLLRSLLTSGSIGVRIRRIDLA
jgi:hypothetical protein